MPNDLMATADGSKTDTLRSILRDCGRLAVPAEQVGVGDDLFAAGLDSMAVVNVMLAIEDRFDIEIPETLLTRRAFSSLAAMEKLVADVLAARG